MDDDDRRPFGIPRRARRAKLLRHRHKEGFDRLGIVLLALAALAFGLLWLFVNEPYALPAEGTPEARAIAAEIDLACRDDLEQALVLLCRERVLGGHRWRHYSSALDLGSNGWLYGSFLALIVLALLWPAGRWVVAGFRRGRAPES